MEALRDEIADLKRELAEKDAAIEALVRKLRAYERVENVEVCQNFPLQPMEEKSELTNTDVAKFSRQIILPEFRVKSQKILKKSSVLIVGCGGLGCPASVYLAGAGVGRIGLVDYDTVDLSNLHRQILHTQTRLGELKCVSIAKSLNELNPDSEYIPIHTALNSTNALEIVGQFDVVVDCSDNVATRYLLNDACVLAGKPLVSGSALRWEGQLTVYNLDGGPTYRCLYPTPPPPSAVTNCSDGGVVGVVPGVIGVLQALETIKILTQGKSSLNGKLLLFDALEGRFRTVKLRNRTDEANNIEKLIDYEEFCGASATDKDEGVTILRREERLSAKDLERLRDEGKPHMLLDVRTDTEFEIGAIQGSQNLPMDLLQSESAVEKTLSDVSSNQDVVVICRRGNDSQTACLLLRQHFKKKEVEVSVRDVVGGLHAWARHVDNSFPVY